MKQLRAKLKILLIGVLSILFLISVAFGIETMGGGPKIVIGAKNCTEQHILSEIIAQLVERETDLRVIRKFNLEGTTICFNALKSKTIDLYVEYTGTAILDILKESIPSFPLYEYVKGVFETKFGIIWLNRLGFSNQYVLIARRDSGLQKISDLERGVDLRVAFDPEFAARLEPELLALHYEGTSYQKLMDQVLLYFSLANHSIDVMSGFSTDGRLVDSQFVSLEDDRDVLPRYEAAPMVTKACLDKHPELLDVLKKLDGVISTQEIRQLNYHVEIEGKDSKQVAAEFLNRSGI